MTENTELPEESIFVFNDGTLSVGAKEIAEKARREALEEVRKALHRECMKGGTVHVVKGKSERWDALARALEIVAEQAERSEGGGNAPTGD